jgi:hypothetical protein
VVGVKEGAVGPVAWAAPKQRDPGVIVSAPNAVTQCPTRPANPATM